MKPSEELQDLHENLLLQIEDADVNKRDMLAHGLRTVAQTTMLHLQLESPTEQELYEVISIARMRLHQLLTTYL
jgi:2-oxo-4-hydroxy-4-carboxy--5-ureidoimidazoline (OHCU) decarboxylase